MPAKFIEIDKTKDYENLFHFFCKNIIQLKPDDAKRTVFGITGSKLEVQAVKPTINDIASACEKMGLKFIFRVEYQDNSFEAVKETEIIPDFREGLEESEVSQKMEEQRENIEDLSLLANNIGHPAPGSSKPQIPSLDPDEIPDFS